MSTFKVVEILDKNIIQVEPGWKFANKDGSEILGNRIMIRGLDGDSNNSELIKDRLRKLLLQDKEEVEFKAPELVAYSDPSKAVVSCSVYVANSNVVNYFPEYVYKY